MSEVAELATRAKISDPTPTRCAACFSSPTEGVRFVDFGASIDRGAVVEEGSMAVIDSIDELHVCEACLRHAGEVLGFKPQLHSKQLREIRKLELRVEHWEAYAKRLEATLQERPEVAPRASRR